MNTGVEAGRISDWLECPRVDTRVGVVCPIRSTRRCHGHGHGCPRRLGGCVVGWRWWMHWRAAELRRMRGAWGSRGCAVCVSVHRTRPWGAPAACMAGYWRHTGTTARAARAPLCCRDSVRRMMVDWPVSVPSVRVCAPLFFFLSRGVARGSCVRAGCVVESMSAAAGDPSLRSMPDSDPS